MNMRPRAAVDLESATALIRVATAAAFGKWREDQSVTLSKSRRVLVKSRREIPLFLDGERVKAGNTVEINFIATAVKVMVPCKRRG